MSFNSLKDACKDKDLTDTCTQKMNLMKMIQVQKVMKTHTKPATAKVTRKRQQPQQPTW